MYSKNKGIIQLFVYSLLTTSLFIFLCKPYLVDAGNCFRKTKKRSGSNGTTPRPNYVQYQNIQHEQKYTDNGNNSPQHYHVTSNTRTYYPNTSMSYGEISDQWGSISDSDGTSDTESGNKIVLDRISSCLLSCLSIFLTSFPTDMYLHV
ncbi:unnamed protein product [Meloidogyne enterolobii]|uniref:Uncharacterized protein n=2 Tax=Meloidogyne enterolobii TaxID=390850 RepID=A0ACB1AZR8_MELEN|nr:unnamed protein product [Meloidogyne enterolobii]